MTAETPTIVVIPVGPEVAGELAELHRQMFDPAWDAAGLASMLQQPGTIGCLARAGDVTANIGLAIVRVVADEAEILTIGTLPAWRCRRVGARMVEELVRLAAVLGAERLFLEVAADNTAAQALYLKHGFVQAGLRRGYYERSGESPVDAAILVKRLVP